MLVDHGTASSAEIVTAALQDHGRAKIVGTDTYGKGVFQITEPLNNGGALDLTIWPTVVTSAAAARGRAPG